VKKTKQIALKAIQANFNDPTIEKAIPTPKKRTNQSPRYSPSQEVGSQKQPPLNARRLTQIL
jgi:hypothetical protein